jgi:putative sterol carrier protein
MPDATTTFFQELGSRGHDPRLSNARGTLRFDVTNGSRVARWLVEIDQGDITVSRRNAKADCVVRAGKDVFDGIAKGEVNAFTAVLRGAMSIDGERELLVFFQRLLPPPPDRSS